jgi:seryl-tRNA synthetase
MLDVELIRRDPKRVEENLARRRNPAYGAMFTKLLGIDEEWRQAQREASGLRQKRNELSRKLSEVKKAGRDAESLKKEASELPRQIGNLERREAELDSERRTLLLRLPNLLDETVPYGKDDSENVTVSTWGKTTAAPSGLPSHGEYLETHGLADFERARRNSGAGFYYLMGPVALLDMALQRLAVDMLVAKGFTPVVPPFLLRREPYEGVTDLSDFENVMYKIQDEDLYLIATSEHPIAALYRGEILAEESLPLRFVGISACFRKEIGGHGVDQKGIYRVHQFQKVEQFVFAPPDQSPAIHEEIRENAENFLRRIGIPYRVVNVCTGDLGIVAAKKYDVEGWFPRQGKYGELISCSNCTDYQARRLGIRMGKRGSPGKTVPHTLNSTMVASPRAIAAILENFATEDGRVTVPEALRPYLGGLKDFGAPPQAR